MQEEKGGPTCQESLFLHKLYAPATKSKVWKLHKISTLYWQGNWGTCEQGNILDKYIILGLKHKSLVIKIIPNS